jgi:hypothetical protein
MGTVCETPRYLIFYSYLNLCSLSPDIPDSTLFPNHVVYLTKSWKILCQVNTEDCPHILLKHRFISTISLRHVSALKGPSSGSMIDTLQHQGQQTELPDVNLWKSQHFYKKGYSNNH